MRKENLLLIMLLATACCFAQPNPNRIQVINGVSVWNDLGNPAKYYYSPGNLALALDKAGNPMVKLMLIRYTGNSINKDEGRHRMKSILQFRVKQETHSRELLNSIKERLHAISLNPLPVYKTSFIVALPSLSNTDTARATNGFFEKGENETSASYWSERDFTLRLDDFTAQYVKAQLDSSKLLMYCAWTFYLKTFVPPDTTGFTGTQTSNVPVAPIAIPSQPTATADARIIPIVSNAFGIDVDTKHWQDIVSLIDINSKLPPSYPCLDVYCYDFTNASVDSLYEKTIRLKATGIAGDEVQYMVKFNRKMEDVYAATVRFKYAVRLDLPFSYQVSSINADGDQFSGEWITEPDWSRMIDITTAGNHN